MIAGAILALGKRTVSALLRIVGLNQEKTFHKYHRLIEINAGQADLTLPGHYLLHNAVREINFQPTRSVDEFFEWIGVLRTS